MNGFIKTVVGGFSLIAVASAAIAMSSPQAAKSAAEQADILNKQAQDDVKARATQAVPVPPITNFQARKNLAEFMSRQDEAGKIWYVYERAPMTGEILGFYQSSSYPQSVCTFMTPPEEMKKVNVDHGQYNGDMAVPATAIALDGVYYKGGDCPDFFFDYNTGAMVVLDSDAVTIAVDQPLDVQAPNFSFVVQDTEE